MAHKKVRGQTPDWLIQVFRTLENNHPLHFEGDLKNEGAHSEAGDIFRYAVSSSGFTRHYEASSDTLIDVKEGVVSSSPTAYVEHRDPLASQCLRNALEEQSLEEAERLNTLVTNQPLVKHTHCRRFYEPRAIKLFTQDSHALLASHSQDSVPGVSGVLSDQSHLLLYPSYNPDSLGSTDVIYDSAELGNLQKPFGKQEQANQWLSNTDISNLSCSELPLRQTVPFSTPGPSFRPYRTITPLPWAVAEETWSRRDIDGFLEQEQTSNVNLEGSDEFEGLPLDSMTGESTWSEHSLPKFPLVDHRNNDTLNSIYPASERVATPANRYPLNADNADNHHNDMWPFLTQESYADYIEDIF